MKNFFILSLLVFISYQTSAKETIIWRTPTEVEALMKKSPRKVIVDFYTDWCGWCKKMDKITYENDYVIKYINNNFYAIKFDAESKDSFQFMGEKYGYDAQKKVNTWALKFLNGQLSYPTTLFFQQNFQYPMSAPGFMDVPKFEAVIKYIKNDVFKTTNFEEFMKAFKNEWS